MCNRLFYFWYLSMRCTKKEIYGLVFSFVIMILIGIPVLLIISFPFVFIFRQLNNQVSVFYVFLSIFIGFVLIVGVVFLFSATIVFISLLVQVCSKIRLFHSIFNSTRTSNLRESMFRLFFSRIENRVHSRVPRYAMVNIENMENMVNLENIENVENVVNVVI